MKNISLTKDQARRLHKVAPVDVKILLEETFPHEFIEDIPDFIKTYEEACNLLQEEPLNELEMLEKGFTSNEIIFRKLKTIAAALNGDWIPSWKDEYQEKWIPTFKVDPLCFNSDQAYCNCKNPTGNDSINLCFKSQRLANYAAKQFIDLYANLLLD